MAVNRSRLVEVYGGLRALERFLFPWCCLLCGGAAAGRDLCAGCAADLPGNAPACPVCALPGTAGLACGTCLRRPPPWDAAACLLRYRSPADALLKACKFGGRLAIARVLGELLAERLADARVPRPGLVVPVPLHPHRERERGFNQARELARPIGRALGIAVDAELCARVRATPPQTGLDARARRRNLRGAFALYGPLRCTHVAIVDDVVTTGATAGALADALRRAGAERVELWAAARALPPRRR
jgi:ComF family protein